MDRMANTIFVMLVILLFALRSEAALEWAQQQVRLEILPAQMSSRAVFRFVNTGDEQVSIQNVKGGCGCLMPKLAKRTFAPGEKGEVEVIFNLQGRVGKQHKNVFVSTSDGMRYTLKLEADIPRTYIVEPRLLKWEKGSDIVTKTARLVNHNQTPIILTTAHSSDTNVTAKLIPIREGFEYEVEVTRSKTGHHVRAVISVETKPPKGLEKSQIIQFYVLVP